MGLDEELIDGYWNGEPAKIRRVRGEIDEPEAEEEFEWWHHYVREIVDAVEVRQNSEVFYIYDLRGKAWEIVTDPEGVLEYPEASLLKLKDIKYRFIHGLGEACDNCEGTGFDYFGNTCRRMIN